ncbi:MAG TPA: cytochrome c oxidase assembly protein [Planctomycetaceae bacterium]|nr:cytochrome c oxidase assembly protein [Planctomycetaceae bacterium]
MPARRRQTLRSRIAAAAGGLLVVVLPAVADAHGGGMVTPGRWWAAWNWQPAVLASLALLAGACGLGLCRLWRRAGAGRGVSRWQAIACGGGLLALTAALVSPLDALSDELAWVHMVQHMLLMMVAAPLFVAGTPLRLMPWALPRAARRVVSRWRRRLGAWHSPWYLLWQPLLLWSLFAATLWVWHWPVLYEAALNVPLVHDAQHITFFVAACLFWRVLVDPVGRLRLGRGVGVLYLFTTSLHATLLGVFMTLSPRLWYAPYEGRAAAWNLTPLEDQQLAGLIMWMPACSIFAVAAAWLFGLWLSDPGAGRWRGAVRTVFLAAAFAPLSGCGRPSPAPANDAAAGHGHRAGAHGGFVAAVGDAHYHVELVIERDGTLRLYTLGADESQVIDVMSQTLNSYVRISGESRSMPVPLKPAPQDGDAPGRTSQFIGRIADEFAGQPLDVTVPSLRIGSERFRAAFHVPARVEQPAMPAKVVDADERALYLVAGGRYTEADIDANGRATASEKFSGFQARHDPHPRAGERICPVTRTKGNPLCTWIIGGETYEFCCPPCIDEFVRLAKEQPDRLGMPGDYVQQ